MIELLAMDSWFPLAEIWDTTVGFIVLLAAAIGALGLASRSLAVAGTAAYLVFVYLSLYADASVINDIMLVTLVLVCLGFVWKLWRHEGLPGGGGDA